jgi:hypothetical protein
VNCTDAYEAILEADPAVLRGEGAGELARHLLACTACRARARRVLDATDALDQALEAEGVSLGGRRRAIPTRPRLARRLAPWGLVAAAAAAGVLLLSRPGAPGRPDVAAPAPSAVAVDVDLSSSARPVAVLRTADPNITVVWFF